MEKASHLWASCWMAVLLATRIMVKTLVATGAARMGAAMTAAFLPNSSTLQIVLQPDMYTVSVRFLLSVSRLFCRVSISVDRRVCL